MSSNKVIQGLWVGTRLSTMEVMCIKSYQAHGHEFHLYTYGPLKNIPEGTVVKDANEIVPESDIKKFQNFANFSDWWRWNMLYKNGGWYADLDAICLRPLDMEDEYVFSDGDLGPGMNRVGVGNVKVPPQSEFAKYCLDRIVEMKFQIPEGNFSGFGPALACEAIIKLGLQRYIWPTWAFLPISCCCFDKIMFKDEPLLPYSYVVHLWDYLWYCDKKLDKDKRYHASLYERLIKRYIDGDVNALKFLPVKNKNVLIGVVTTDNEKYLKKSKAQFDTWTQRARVLGFDVAFFHGGNLGVPDSPYAVAIKAKAAAIYKYALERGYNYLLKVDDDAAIVMDKLAIPTSDYAGFQIDANDLGLTRDGVVEVPDYPAGTHPYAYASGGAAWFSHKALQILVDSLPITGDWADDRWAGQILGRAGVKFTPLRGYYICPNGPRDIRDLVVMTQCTTAELISKYSGQKAPPTFLVDGVVMTEVEYKTMLEARWRERQKGKKA